MKAIKATLSKFQSVDDYVRGWGLYYYGAGILLPTRRAEEKGTEVSLNIEIADGEPVLRGTGVVEDVRTRSDGATVGLVIRFTKLDARSKELTQQILAGKQDARTSAAHTAHVASERSESGAVSLADDDLGAIADALDETFDSIFSSGSFAPATSSSGDQGALSPGPTESPAEFAHTAEGESPTDDQSADSAVADADQLDDAPSGDEPPADGATETGEPGEFDDGAAAGELDDDAAAGEAPSGAAKPGRAGGPTSGSAVTDALASLGFSVSESGSVAAPGAASDERALDSDGPDVLASDALVSESVTGATLAASEDQGTAPSGAAARVREFISGAVDAGLDDDALVEPGSVAEALRAAERDAAAATHEGEEALEALLAAPADAGGVPDVAPRKKPKGLFSRFIAWLKGLFGG